MGAGLGTGSMVTAAAVAAAVAEHAVVAAAGDVAAAEGVRVWLGSWPWALVG